MNRSQSLHSLHIFNRFRHDFILWTLFTAQNSKMFKIPDYFKCLERNTFSLSYSFLPAFNFPSFLFKVLFYVFQSVFASIATAIEHVCCISWCSSFSAWIGKSSFASSISRLYGSISFAVTHINASSIPFLIYIEPHANHMQPDYSQSYTNIYSLFVCK